jgi:hypothetical protein
MAGLGERERMPMRGFATAWLRRCPVIATTGVFSMARIVMALLAATLRAISIAAGPVEAEIYGPEPYQADRDRSIPFMNTDGRRLTHFSPEPAMPRQGFGRADSRLWSYPVSEAETIERVSGEERGPRIPEPMVFDLVRPLGATRGEMEVNTLGMVPLSRKTGRVNNTPDPLGLVRRSPDRQGIEWAPEIEYTIRDGLAVEFELPMENGQLEAYKGASQVTFGTAFNHHFIHGAQAIVQYDLEPKLWTATWLYLAGVRLDKTWSLFGMFGPRHEIGPVTGGRKVELLSNLTVFADVTDRVVAGVETNVGQVLGGNTSLLVMPQIHHELGAFWMLQAGAGARFTSGFTLPEIGFRLIREF